VFAAYAFGLLMNLSGWPFVLGILVPGHAESLAFVAGDPLWDNLRRFGVYTLLTSTGSFDTGRAITNSVAILVLGPAVLTTLRRAARRATVTGIVADARADTGADTRAADTADSTAASDSTDAPGGVVTR
jgi:energy-coupling factor transport system substrate-specific component